MTLSYLQRTFPFLSVSLPKRTAASVPLLSWLNAFNAQFTMEKQLSADAKLFLLLYCNNSLDTLPIRFVQIIDF